MPNNNPTGKGGFKERPEQINKSSIAKLSDETKELKNITREEHIKKVCELLQKTGKEIEQIVKNPYTDCHTLLIASLISKAITKGDAFIYEKLTDRVLGKVTLSIGGDIDKPLLVKMI